MIRFLALRAVWLRKSVARGFAVGCAVVVVGGVAVFGVAGVEGLRAVGGWCWAKLSDLLYG